MCPSITPFHLRYLTALHHLEDLTIRIDVQNIGESEQERTEVLDGLSRAMLPLES